MWCLIPQSHCAESTAERGRIDHSSSVGGSFLVILGHFGNDSDNDNQFEQCSSHLCNAQVSLCRIYCRTWTNLKILKLVPILVGEGTNHVNVSIELWFFLDNSKIKIQHVQSQFDKVQLYLRMTTNEHAK